MRIRLRNIDRKIHGIFNAVIAIAGQSHQISSAALHFNHVAQSFLVKSLLCHNPNHQRALFNKTDGPMFQLSRSISFGMHIADLFHFQASLKADGIVQSASDKENISRVRKLAGKPLNTLFIRQDLFDLSRKQLHFCQHGNISFLTNASTNSCCFHRQQIAIDQLRTVCFCGSYGDFRSGQSVHYIVRLPGNTGAHYINDAQCFRAFLFCQAKRCQTVCGLS